MFDQLELAGIPDSTLSKDHENCEPILDKIWYKKKDVDKPFQTILEWMYKSPNEWARKGNFIIIDGGNHDQRQMVLGIYLMRAIFANAKEQGQIAKSVHVSEILTSLGSVNNMKLFAVSSFVAPPVLAIEEVDPSTFPSMSKDGGIFIDSLLIGRKKHGVPTLITLAVPYDHEDFFTYGRMFGGVFDSIIQSNHSIEKGILKIKLSGITEN